MIATAISNKKALGFGLAVVVALVLAVPFGLPDAQANHPDGSCLDVTLETDTNPVGTVHSVTATLKTPASTPPEEPGEACDEDETDINATSTVRISFELTGPNDTDGNTPDTPDQSCLVLTGQPSCTMEYLGNVTGTDTIRGWIDHDGLSPGQGGITEADTTEGQDEEDPTQYGEGCAPGFPTTLPEPDCTDVVTKSWTHGPPDALDCDDSNGPDTERETNPHAAGAQSNEIYHCDVFDEFGNLTTDTEVIIRGEHKNGVNDPEPSAQEGSPTYDTPDYKCTTADANGEVGDSEIPGEEAHDRRRGGCDFTVTQADGEIGTTQICFWIGSDGATVCTNEVTEENQQPDGSDTANDEADQVEKTWEQRRAASVDAEPETDTNSTGTNHRIHAFVFDQFGSQFQGNTTVKFEFFSGSPADTDGNTPNSPDRSCTTSNSNTCSIQYTSGNAGTDLVCVWVGDTPPNMQGNNVGGTCDGEGLNDPDDEPSQSSPPTGDAPEPGTDHRDVVQKQWQNPNAATRLDCDPETDTNPSGSSHTVTCTTRNESNSAVSQTQVDIEASGSNDPQNDGYSPQTPDFSCTTGSDGVCSFTHGPSGQGTTTQGGVTTYRAWIDSDNNNNSVEADPDEGRNEGASPGQRGEPDDTDVVEKTWEGGPTPTPTGTTSPTPTPTPTATQTPQPPECDDNIDNDGDGEIDFPDDPGCSSASDDSEEDGFVPRACRNVGPGQNVIVGTSGNDAISGTSGDDVICGAGGNDVIDARGGADLVTGNAGDDTISGGRGKDNLSGNKGHDTISGQAGNDVLRGGGGRDTLKGNKGIDTIRGGGGSDTLQGGKHDDVLRGGKGRDVLRGFTGDDFLDGGPGIDKCFGGRGNDTLRRCE